VGIVLAITAAALGTTSKQLIAISEHLGKAWLFHIGAGINIAVGPVVDASAYAFAPQVIVAPFACLDVIFNALTAPYTLRWQNEVLTRKHILGTGLVSVGAVLTSVFADAENEVYTIDELEAQLVRTESVMYMAIELTLILTVNFYLKAGKLSPQIRGVSLGVIAGVLMGNVFFLKGLIGLVRTTITTGEFEAWGRPTPYILAACAGAGAVIGHCFMRKGLGEYKGVFMVTIFQGSHITAACLSGWVVMSEMSGAPWWRFVLYWSSVGLIMCGIAAINMAAKDSEVQKAFHIAQHHHFKQCDLEEDPRMLMKLGRSEGSHVADLATHIGGGFELGTLSPRSPPVNGSPRRPSRSGNGTTFTWSDKESSFASSEASRTEGFGGGGGRESDAGTPATAKGRRRASPPAAQGDVSFARTLPQPPQGGATNGIRPPST